MRICCDVFVSRSRVAFDGQAPAVLPMPQCPMCNKTLRELTRKCPTCQADLDLLVDYSSFLSGGLQRAENLTRAGELAQAIVAYLEVLEIDPDNPAARRQIGRMVTAVRQFDQASPVHQMNNPSPNGKPQKTPWDPQFLRTLIFGGMITFVFVLGLLLGFALAGGTGQGGANEGPAPPPALGE